MIISWFRFQYPIVVILIITFMMCLFILIYLLIMSLKFDIKINIKLLNNNLNWTIIMLIKWDYYIILNLINDNICIFESFIHSIHRILSCHVKFVEFFILHQWNISGLVSFILKCLSLNIKIWTHLMYVFMNMLMNVS